MTSLRTRKIIRWSLGILVGLLVLLVAVVFAVVRIIDTPSVRADLSKRLSEAVDGQVTWQALEIRFFPLPHGVVRNAHFEMPNLVKVDVATAEVTLRMLPLLHGSAELKTVTVLQPNVDVWIANSPDESSTANESPTPVKNPLEIYRAVMRPILDGIANFAPDTTLAIDQARVAIHVADLPPFEASDLDLNILTDGVGVAVNASAMGTYWDNVELKGRLEFADLSADIKLDAAGLKPQPVLEALLTNIRQALVLSSVGAKLQARTDGKTTIDAALELDLPKAELQRRGKRYDIVEVRVGGTVEFRDQDINIALNKIHLGDLVPVAQASLTLTGPNHESQLGIEIETLDLLRLRDALATLVSEPPELYPYLARIHGGQLRNLKFATQAATLGELFSLPRLRASVAVQGGRLLIPAVEIEASNLNAQIELVDGVLKAKEVSARLGASQIRQASAEVVLVAPLRLSATRAQATLQLDDLLARLRTQPQFAELLASVPDLAGTADLNVNNVALPFDQPAQVLYDVTVRPRRFTVQSDLLPTTLNIQGGSARITTRAIVIDRVGVSVFGSRAAVSGEITEFTTPHPRVAARVNDGTVDSKSMDWIWQRAGIPDRFKPLTPIQLTAQRVQWNDAGLDVAADAQFGTGPLVSVDLFMHDKTFIVRRGTFKDRDSDAVVTFALHDPFIELGFNGVIAGRSLATILGQSPEQYSGRINGDLQLTLDLERQRRTVMRGKLTGDRIDLNKIIGLPINLERFEMQGDGAALHILELTADWAEQKATLRGDITRTENGLGIAVEVDTPGIVFDALQAATAETTDKPATNAATKTPTEEPTPEPSKSDAPNPWSLPLSGTVALRANFLEYQHYRAEGLRALLTLEHEDAKLILSEGSLCGIAVPLTLHATPKTFEASVRLSVKNQSLGDTAQCLQSEQVSITGNFDLSATLSAQGELATIADSLTKSLSGSIVLHAREGEIHQLKALGNILSLKAVGDILQGDVKLGANGFKYRTIALISEVKDGTVTVEQASMDSPALGLAATGTIRLTDYDSRLTVLVAPFGRLDSVMRKVPIVGYVMGGALTSIPVGVSGDIRDPRVVPLGPSAVGSEVLGIFERTFSLPGKMVEPLSKPKEKQNAPPKAPSESTPPSE